MNKPRILTIKNLLIGIGIIIFDFVVYIILGLLLMNYDDFYDESKGEYWSLQSMTLWEIMNYIGLNLWHLINLIAIGYIIYRIVKRMKTPYNNAHRQ